MKRASRARAIGALLAAGVACGPAPSVATTSIRESDCRPPAAAITAQFDEKALGVQQCPGAAGWDVLVVSSDANSWIVLRSGTTSWSAEEAIVYDMPIGLFPGVQGDAPLEWRSAGGDLRALLFTVSALDPADAETRLRRVFVARFADDGPACVLGRTSAIEDARALADGDAPCPAP